MEAERLLWLAALAAFPSAVIGSYALGVRGERLLRLSIACSSLLTAVTAVPLAAEFCLRNFVWQGCHPLSAVLVPFAALLWLLSVAVTPSGRLDEAGLARNAAACLLQMAAFLTISSAALIAIWIASALLFAFSHQEPRFTRARRLILSHLGLSSALLIAGVALMKYCRGHVGLEQWGVALILLAVILRQGIFPFHAWIPEIFEHGRIGPAVRFQAPQIGMYVALVLAVPHAHPALLRAVAILAVVTAVYGALLALHQADARRACGYLFISQSALVVAGLDLSSPSALAGALILWVASGIALAGLSRAVLALEARRGRLRLDMYHGGYERMPRVAASFLVMCLAIANFPGTLGFIGGEMLVRGAVEVFPLLGLFAVAAAAFNGLAAMRMYFSLFCGKRGAGPHLAMRRWEGIGFAAAAVFLLGFGLMPRTFVRILGRASAAVVDPQKRLRIIKGSRAW